MTSKCSSSAAGGRTDKLATMKRIAVVAAVVLLLSMAVVGAASAYTVTYDGNGADSGNVPEDTTKYSYGDIVTVKGNTVNLTKKDYYFAGWNTQADGTGTTYYPGDSFTINNSMMLYAKWSQTYYKVTLPSTTNMTFTGTWYGDGTTGIYGTDMDHVPEGAIVTITAAEKNSDSDSHYAVKYDDWECTTVNVKQENKVHNTYSFRMGSSDVEVTASESEAVFKVTYKSSDATSGTVPVDLSWYANGDAVILLGNTGSLVMGENVFFAGWKVNNTGNLLKTGDACSITGNVELYAQWTTEYTELEYIESTGTQYIDTGWYLPVGKDNFSMVVDFAGTGTQPGTWAKICGVDLGGQGETQYYLIQFNGYSAPSALCAHNGDENIKLTWANEDAATTKYTVQMNYNSGQTKVTINGVDEKTINSAIEKRSSNTCFLFAGSRSGNVAGTTSRIKLFSWKVSVNGKLERNMIPCQTAGGVVGLYDTVEGKFYGNDGTGSIIAGNYPVTYYANTAESGWAPVDKTAYPIGEYVTVRDNTGNLTKTGYYFAGWNTKSDGTGTDYTVGSTLQMPAGNVTLYAKWSKNQGYTVAYNANGADSGTVPVDSEQYTSGAEVTVKGKNTLAKSGYSFAGWTLTYDGTGTVYNQGEKFEITSNTTLYAKWTDTVSYTFTIPATVNLSQVTGAAGRVGGNDTCKVKVTANGQHAGKKMVVTITTEAEEENGAKVKFHLDGTGSSKAYYKVGKGTTTQDNPEYLEGATTTGGNVVVSKSLSDSLIEGYITGEQIIFFETVSIDSAGSYSDTLMFKFSIEDA